MTDNPFLVCIASKAKIGKLALAGRGKTGEMKGGREWTSDKLKEGNGVSASF